MKHNNPTIFKEHPLEALSETFIQDKKLSDSTVNSYRIVYKKFIQYLKGADIVYPKTSDVIKYREYQRTCGASTYYIHIQMSALKGLFHYLKVNQDRLSLPIHYSYDIMEKIKSEQIQHKIRKPVLTLEEAKHFILSTKRMRHTIHQYRNHAIISLMITGGLSPHQVVHVTLSDYRMVDGAQVLYLENRNRREKDIIRISKGTTQAIDDYLIKRKDDNPYLFHGHKANRNQPLNRMFFYTMFRQLLKDTGLEYTKITPHSLRHTAALLNLERGASIEQTKAFMRHSSIKSTLVYQDYLNRMKDDSEYQIESLILKEDRDLALEFTQYITYE